MASHVGVTGVSSGTGAVLPMPLGTVGNVSTALQRALHNAAAQLPPAPHPSTAHVPPNLLPAAGKAPTNAIEAAARFFAERFQGLDFGAHREVGGRTYPGNVDMLSRMVDIALRFETVRYPQHDDATRDSLALIRGGILARFPQQVPLVNRVAMNVIYAWTEQVLANSALLPPDEITELITEHAEPAVRQWTQDEVQKLVNDRLKDIVMDDKARRHIARAIADYPGFQYPQDLSHAEIGRVDLAAQVQQTTRLWTAGEELKHYLYAVDIFLDRDTKKCLQKQSAEHNAHLYWLVGKAMSAGRLAPHSNAVSNAMAQYLEAILDPAANPDAYFALLAEETGVTITIPAELGEEDAQNMKLDLVDHLSAMPWSQEMMVAEHVDSMRAIVTAGNNFIALKMLKAALDRRVVEAFHLITQLQVPDLATHLTPAETREIAAHYLALHNAQQKILGAATSDEISVAAVDEAVRAARIFARQVGPRLREASVAAAAAAGAAGGGAGGSAGGGQNGQPGGNGGGQP